MSKFQDMFDPESRTFLLTKVNGSLISAERLRTPDDPRLLSEKPFALVKVEHAILSDAEMSAIESMTGEAADRFVDAIGDVLLLRPRLANQVSAHEPDVFIDALKHTIDDSMLEWSADEEEWVVSKTRPLRQ